MIDILNDFIDPISFYAAAKGLRLSFNSECDTKFDPYNAILGENDYKLMLRLANKGRSSESKFRRMMHVYVLLSGPLYWWKQVDTYKIGTVCQSGSTMHTIDKKEFTISDFSCENMIPCGMDGIDPIDILNKFTIPTLNECRELYLITKDRNYWDQLIQLLPESYNQVRMLDLNYETLSAIYKDRKNHKLQEWHQFCEWIKTLPYSDLIIGGGDIS